MYNCIIFISFQASDCLYGLTQTRRGILQRHGKLWESRRIHCSAGKRIHKLELVWDGTARDEESGLSVESRHKKSENGAKEHARDDLRDALLKQGIIWNPAVATAL